MKVVIIAGLEPDESIVQSAYFHDFCKCGLEEAPLEESTFDVAYAAFVLEHLGELQVFFGISSILY